MTQKIKITGFVLILLSLLTISFAQAQAQNSKDTLNQYITDLQKNPTDQALREKIIKFVQGMNPKPAISAEAVKFANRGEYAAKTAKTESDYADASEEYKKAVNIAPWVAGYYFNMGVLWEKANQPQVAVAAFKLYLLAEPNAKDANEIQKRIDGLEYASEKAAKSSPEAVAAQEQKSEDWLKKLDGGRFFVNGVEQNNCLEIRGKEVVMGQVVTGVFRENNFYPRYTIKGREFDMPANPTADINHSVAKIDEDGTTITVTFDNGGKQVFRSK